MSDISSITVEKQERYELLERHENHESRRLEDLPIYSEMLGQSRILTITDINIADELFKQLLSDLFPDTQDQERGQEFRQEFNWVFAGFDLEWSSNRKVSTTDSSTKDVPDEKVSNKTAMIQISVRDSKGIINTFLVRTMIFFDKTHKDYSSNHLVKFLENPRVYKVGVEIDHDKHKLFHDFGITVRSVVDIRHIYHRFEHKITISPDVVEQKVDCTRDGVTEMVRTPDKIEVTEPTETSKLSLISLPTPQPQQLSLASLTKKFCGHVMPKPFKVRCGNWCAENLTKAQILYASADSFYALKIVERILEDVFITTGSMAGIVDRPFKVKTKPKLESKLEQNPESERTDIVKQEKTKCVHKPRLSTNVYGNIKFLDKDGNFMFYCNKDKADWYTTRKLAVQLEDKVYKLTFEAKGKGNQTDKYMHTELKNMCVVCGETSQLVHHYVVPYAYRQVYPTAFKSHSHVDIVLMCSTCKLRTSDTYSRKIVSFARSMGVHTNKPNVSENSQKRRHIVKRCELAIKYLTGKLNLPVEKGAELMKEIEQIISALMDSDLYNVSSFVERGIQHNDQEREQKVKITKELLDHVIDQIQKEESEETYPVPNIFVKVLNAWLNPHSLSDNPSILADKIHQFNKMWRQFFLDVAEPKHLPNGWSVDHRKSIQ
ncbi:hypothetical protein YASMINEVIRUS_765 [Yasminevirus sp. GU-2018]|uniref:3'-5' exonuclease domain-containing protein n=1 Tax=Yasminevirus sp. GU-2018 TaxID=2420051 RepID=A0A5K0U9Y7_9VIRU|nr:hypothetical protein YASMINEVIRUS_765 [Yasminevirus sp. GU-2018]